MCVCLVVNQLSQVCGTTLYYECGKSGKNMEMQVTQTSDMSNHAICNNQKKCACLMEYTLLQSNMGNGKSIIYRCLFQTCFIFHNISVVILPIDELIFFKMAKATNQYRCLFPAINLHLGQILQPRWPILVIRFVRVVWPRQKSWNKMGSFVAVSPARWT